MPYISQAEKLHLVNFQYAGGTDSITYKYLWSPIDEYLLKFVPLSIAPNLITLFAFSILLFSHIVFMLPDNGPIPAWKLIMMAVSIILYQHLDNIDGKQARRTKSSSSLGMLFDHGADAVSAFLLAIQVMKILGLSYNMQLFAICIFIMNTYFCAMWSQYCVGYFRLGVVNPVDEGLPFYAFMCLLATQLDLSACNQHHIVGSYSDEVIYILLILLVPTDISLCWDIFRKPIRPLSEVLFMLLLYISGALCCFFFFWKAGPLTADTFYPFVYCLTFMWARNMIQIQFQFIVKQKYQVFNIATNLLILSVAIFVLLGHHLPVTTSQYFIGWAVVQGLVFLEMCTSVLREGAELLEIHIFRLGKRGKTN